MQSGHDLIKNQRVFENSFPPSARPAWRNIQLNFRLYSLLCAPSIWTTFSATCDVQPSEGNLKIVAKM